MHQNVYFAGETLGINTRSFNTTLTNCTRRPARRESAQLLRGVRAGVGARRSVRQTRLWHIVRFTVVSMAIVLVMR